jgi:trans-aconitate 2-methyltransferase
MSDPWNPEQYDKFQREREQPFFDLLDMVRPEPDMRVVDLGCGTGRLTLLLHQRLKPRETVGIDRSARMLESIGREAALPAGLRFEVGTIESFPTNESKYDLIFSNAALHWVDDHEALFRRLADSLARGGQLAVQMPSMFDDPSQTIATGLVADEPYRSASRGWRRLQPVLTPEEYARLLFRLGFDAPAVRLIVYPHVLAGPDAVIEWTKGTVLAEYSRHLPPDLFETFVADYRTRLLERLENAAPFFFPFKRILLWGRLGRA